MKCELSQASRDLCKQCHKSLVHCRTCPLFPRVTLTRKIESHNRSERFAQLNFVSNKYAVHVTRSLELVYI